jgi:hypothetical protein
MRKGFLLAAVIALLLFAPALGAQNCRINSVDPLTGRAGDTIGAVGESIDAEKVEELYLTDGTNDIKVKILEQTDTLIKFTIPSTVKPGRYSLMIKTRGAEPKLLEQPVKLTVEA